MEAFQVWAQMVNGIDPTFTNVPCSLLVFNGGRTIHFWDFEGGNIIDERKKIKDAEGSS